LRLVSLPTITCTSSKVLTCGMVGIKTPKKSSTEPGRRGHSAAATARTYNSAGSAASCRSAGIFSSGRGDAHQRANAGDFSPPSRPSRLSTLTPPGCSGRVAALGSQHSSTTSKRLPSSSMTPSQALDRESQHSLNISAVAGTAVTNRFKTVSRSKSKSYATWFPGPSADLGGEGILAAGGRQAGGEQSARLSIRRLPHRQPGRLAESRRNAAGSLEDRLSHRLRPPERSA
jgi:hypothetical protein